MNLWHQAPRPWLTDVGGSREGNYQLSGHSALAEETSTNKKVIVIFISLEGGEGTGIGEHETK